MPHSDFHFTKFTVVTAGMMDLWEKNGGKQAGQEILTQLMQKYERDGMLVFSH